MTQIRGWKLFFLVPRLLLFRPRRGGSVPRKQLEDRVALFQKGEWDVLLEKSLNSSMDGATGGHGRLGPNRLWPNRVWSNHGACVFDWFLCVWCVLGVAGCCWVLLGVAGCCCVLLLLMFPFFLSTCLALVGGPLPSRGQLLPRTTSAGRLLPRTGPPPDRPGKVEPVTDLTEKGAEMCLSSGRSCGEGVVVLHEAASSSEGWDFPPALGRKSYRRGSLIFVRNLRGRSDVMRKAKAEHEADKYAKSAVESVLSRLWWRQRASEHEVQPLPLTVDKLQLSGASLKASGYRSAVSYLSS